MTSEYSVTICGQTINLRYCAAAEYGYERMTGKSVAVFVPQFEKNEEGQMVMTKLPEASNEDYVMLAMAAIVAYYSKQGQDAPISTDDILYNASPTEITQLMTTVMKARNEWYGVPEVVKEKLEEERQQAEARVQNEEQKEGEQQKNA